MRRGRCKSVRYRKGSSSKSLPDEPAASAVSLADPLPEQADLAVSLADPLPEQADLAVSLADLPAVLPDGPLAVLEDDPPAVLPDLNPLPPPSSLLRPLLMGRGRRRPMFIPAEPAAPAVSLADPLVEQADDPALTPDPAVSLAGPPAEQADGPPAKQADDPAPAELADPDEAAKVSESRLIVLRRRHKELYEARVAITTELDLVGQEIIAEVKKREEDEMETKSSLSAPSPSTASNLRTAGDLYGLKCSDPEGDLFGLECSDPEEEKEEDERQEHEMSISKQQPALSAPSLPPASHPANLWTKDDYLSTAGELNLAPGEQEEMAELIRNDAEEEKKEDERQELGMSISKQQTSSSLSAPSPPPASHPSNLWTMYECLRTAEELNLALGEQEEMAELKPKDDGEEKKEEEEGMSISKQQIENPTNSSLPDPSLSLASHSIASELNQPQLAMHDLDQPRAANYMVSHQKIDGAVSKDEDELSFTDGDEDKVDKGKSVSKRQIQKLCEDMEDMFSYLTLYIKPAAPPRETTDDEVLPPPIHAISEQFKDLRSRMSKLRLQLLPFKERYEEEQAKPDSYEGLDEDEMAISKQQIENPANSSLPDPSLSLASPSTASELNQPQLAIYDLDESRAATKPKLVEQEMDGDESSSMVSQLQIEKLCEEIMQWADVDDEKIDGDPIISKRHINKLCNELDAALSYLKLDIEPAAPLREAPPQTIHTILAQFKIVCHHTIKLRLQLLPFKERYEEEQSKSYSYEGLSEEETAMKMIEHEEEFFDSYRKGTESSSRRVYFGQQTTLSSMYFTHYTPEQTLPHYAETEGISLQVFSFKIAEIKGNLRWPLLVYGVVAARDNSDRKRNIIFSRPNYDCQELTSSDPFLRLTGPSRAIMALSPVDFEVELKVKGEAGSADRTLMSLREHYIGSTSVDDLDTIVFDNCLCTAELSMEELSGSVQATFLGVRVVRDGPCPFEYGGRIFCSSPPHEVVRRDEKAIGHFVVDPRFQVVLLDSRHCVRGKMPIDKDGCLDLSRRFVSVERQKENSLQFKESLKVVIEAFSESGEIAAKAHVRIRPRTCNISQHICDLGGSKVEITIAWSVTVRTDRC